VKIVPLQEALDPVEFGGKAMHLGAACRAGLPVPPGFAVSVRALRATREQHGGMLSRISYVFETLGPPVACRSSAVGEDGLEASFAGQHLTVLNLLALESAITALHQVHDSAHSDAALAYRRKKNLGTDIQIAAVVQKLVDPESAGVLFTRNPVTGADERVIEAAWGLGETVVAGLVTPDHYRISRDGRVLEARIGEKDLAVRRDAKGGTVEVEVDPELVNARCLSDAWLARLNDLATRAEAHFGRNLDLEWAIAGGVLYLLQSRPISTAEHP
jgi:pyruvate,water dikinase